jgi:DNA-binding MarR family transcriptional regulator
MTEQSNPLALENQLCFPLYVCSKEIVRKYTPVLTRLGLTYTSYIVMMVMWEQKKITVKELGRLLWLDTGTLTPLLKKMEGDGLVDRNRDPEDERSVIVTITEKGADLRKKALAVPEEITKCVPLSHEEGVQLYTLLNKLMGNMRSK